MSPFRHILVATDFSECSSIALDTAIELAGRYGAALTLVHVFALPVYPYMDIVPMAIDIETPAREAADEELHKALAAARTQLPSARAVLKQAGAVWEQILVTAREVGADLIVLGTHGRTGVSHALIGSVAERVVRHSPVPVLTVCRPKRP
jgi:nucleotide-binding universal stress UspA family protein